MVMVVWLIRHDHARHQKGSLLMEGVRDGRYGIPAHDDRGPQQFILSHVIVPLVFYQPQSSVIGVLAAKSHH